MGMQRYSHDPLAGEQGPVASPVISGGRAEGRGREGMRWVLEWRGEQLASKKK